MTDSKPIAQGNNRPPFRRRNTGQRNDNRGGQRGGDRGSRSGRDRRERPKAEFDSKMINLRRVARVVAGGRRFSFSVALVIGDKKGKVGVGVGKAGDTALAIEKATRDGKRKMIMLPPELGNSIPQPIEAKYCSVRLMMRPAPGRGLIAGSAVRTVLSMAGRTDVNAKLLSPTKNKLNIARAALKALAALDPNARLK